MQYILKVRQIYDEYLSDAARLQAAMKATDGLLGFGRRADSDPCHDRFTGQLQETLDAMAAAAVSPAEVLEVLSFMYEKPAPYRNNSLVYIMLLAVQGMTDRLVPLLAPQDAATLAARFTELYPKNSWLPAQKKIVLLLRKQSGGTGSPGDKGFLERLLRRNRPR